MASRKYSLVLYTSLAVAVVATYLVFRYINVSTVRNQIATQPVVVAAKDIPEGAEIAETDLRVEQWPEPVVPDNAFDAVVRVTGRVSHVPIFTGEPIVPGRLAPEGTAPGLEAKITPGKRAMGVRINDVSGMSGMIQPNSRVDILLTLDTPNGEQRSTKMFMENMRVLAMGSEIERGTDGRSSPASVATIEVTPDEAERLAVATSQGQIQLVLRGYSDAGSVKTNGATGGEVVAALKDLPSQAKAQHPQKAAAKRPTPNPKAVTTEAPQTLPAPERAAEPAPKPTPPARPDSLTIPVYRGTNRSDVKLKNDSVRRDTIRKP